MIGKTICAGILLLTLLIGQGTYKKLDDQARLVPRMLNYQGYLTDTLGMPITNSSLSMSFAIFDAISAGNQKWTEAQSVSVNKGIFHVLLGSMTPIPDSVFVNDASRWLELIVAGQTLSPRTRITSAGYAYTSTYSDTAQYARNAAADNDWTFRITDTADTTLQTGGRWGLARAGNVSYGNTDSTHVNFGVACTTGQSGYNFKYCTIAGGRYNTANNNNAVVGGGANNVAGGICATVAGGRYNNATMYGSVGGGDRNAASGVYSTVAGGFSNAASYAYAAVGGGNVDTAKAIFSGVFSGYRNLAGDTTLDSAAVVGGGRDNYALAKYSFIGGGSANSAYGDNSIAAGGCADTTSALYGSVLGGYSNLAGDAAADTGATVGGGWDNSATEKYAFIGGGYKNSANNIGSTVSGGYSNTASGGRATIGGGEDNTANGTSATIGGGFSNDASSYYATISGGSSNNAWGSYATVSGGSSNRADSLATTIGGGAYNLARARYATVSGGFASNATASYATVSGGYQNNAGLTEDDTAAVVAGGMSNLARAKYATIGGGADNYTNDPYTTISGGGNNTTSAVFNTIGGGYNNNAGIGEDDTAAVVVGGLDNYAYGKYSMIPGGRSNYAIDYCFAAGRRAVANQNGCFIWGDTTDADVSPVLANQWVARCSGGVMFYSNGSMTSGVYLAPGGSSWSAVSDRNLKENFQPIDGGDVLSKLLAIPITTWNYKSQDPSIRHIGPMAQDFADFGVGEDDKHITTIDADGVALAAIQELAKQVQELKAENKELQERIEILENR